MSDVDYVAVVVRRSSVRLPGINEFDWARRQRPRPTDKIDRESGDRCARTGRVPRDHSQGVERCFEELSLLSTTNEDSTAEVLVEVAGPQHDGERPLQDLYVGDLLAEQTVKTS